MQNYQEEEESSGPMLIQKLEEVGINTADIKKLTEVGYHTGKIF